MLSLLLNSEAHRNALLKVLNKAYVPLDILIGQSDHLTSNITMDNYISFTDDEIPYGSKGNYKAHHITDYCKKSVLLKIIINNGSTLAVMPLTCLNKLSIDVSYIKHSCTVIQAFDGSCKEVVRNITILF